MGKLTRRGFLGQTSAGVASLGALAAIPTLTNAIESPTVTTTAEELANSTFNTDLVAHVRDVTTGEISLLFGTQEIIYRDPELVGRLLRAAH